ncbi:uridine diphosphate glucose pyrophosphatase NUDT22 [Anabas testudineus]|uniref:Nudix hydrolase domain-containing protein n=1 Tax=Anabas testudineus TaxID=64144 RepID=A0A3Q1ILZ6_ANATE|nr:uridine diphosphate glucose pyrophosphatase NUDT22 [Anabas testudineus]XP_026213519.1 uridine diphosphate glucose pyrophosphatase NUDT22 [Anabas testudineus]
MDPEVSVLLHCAAWRGLLESQVQVELSERFNRQTDPSLECQIKELWTERVSKEPWLFNGAKFRLHSFCFDSLKCPSSPPTFPDHSPCSHSSLSPVLSLDCVEDQDTDLPQDAAQNRNGSTNETETVEGVLHHPRPILTLRLGLTCYKDYLGTNWSCRAKELRQRGEMEFSDPLALLSQPLGVGAVLCTDDGQVVLIRRSQRVAEAGGLLDIPGGHPEPKVVCESLGHEVCEEQISVVMMQQKPEAVVSELFSSVCAEIRDEVNVPLSSLGKPVLMGIALNHTSAGRPSAEFYVSCSLTSDEVRKLYWKGGAEAHESTDIVFISKTQVLGLDRSSPLWSELCPSAKGAVLLFQIVKPGADNNQQVTQS